MRIPAFARRSEPTPATEDVNRDGRVDARDDRPVADTRPVAVNDQVDDRGPHTARPATGAVTGAPPRETDRTPDRTLTDTTVVEPPAGPRARTSVVATVGLVVGLASALMVLTGTLAGYGLALGVVGLLLSLVGMAATGKRHVAGKGHALLGVALSLGAITVGALALTGALPWLTTETDKVEQLRQWLDTQFVDRF
ncbi:MAG TPA: hypothetical protein VES42_07825 [Pilimelia sp.]|nr:hypothetical protein [Pilimelia sp.]